MTYHVPRFRNQNSEIFPWCDSQILSKMQTNLLNLEKWIIVLNRSQFPLVGKVQGLNQTSIIHVSTSMSKWVVKSDVSKIKREHQIWRHWLMQETVSTQGTEKYHLPQYPADFMVQQSKTVQSWRFERDRLTSCFFEI